MVLLAVVAGAPAAAAPTDGPVVFAGSANYPPFQWLDGQGNARGFVVALEDAMAARDGRAVAHRLSDWDEALASVRSGEADAIALFPSQSRGERLDFTKPFYYVAHGIFAIPGTGAPARLDRIAGHSVAVVAGSYAESRLSTGYDEVTLVRCDDIEACLAAVSDGAAQVAVVATHTARRFAARMDFAVRQVSAPFWPRPYVFAVREGDTAMREWLDQQLAMIQISGQYNEIYNDWRGELEWSQPTMVDSLRFAAWVLVPLLALATLGYGWSWVLRRQVRRRTRELTSELERRRRLEDELQYRVEHDPLTELPNREAFVDRLAAMMQRDPGWSPVLATVRVANLERITTAFSYAVGHELVRAMAQRLQALELALVGHFGSGVFAIASDRAVSGDDLVRLVTAPLELESMDVDPQIAAGIANERPDGAAREAAEELIRRSRTALAGAQADGRVWQSYTTDMEPDPGDLLLLRDFHRSGTRDMFLVLQPKVDLATGEVSGAEALVRWQHPEMGLVSPGRFIPLLEHSGLVSRLTEWVVEEAMQTTARLRASGHQCVISINVAPRDLLEFDLVKMITGVMNRIDGGRLQLEITETGFIQDPEQAARILHDLRNIDVHCAVDDFGTGYSSLSYLSEFPVEEVKVDRSFVYDMLSNDRHYVIVRSTIALAHELGLTVTAEGAEDRETLAALASLDCDAVQGYVISGPVSENELLGMLGPLGGPTHAPD